MKIWYDISGLYNWHGNFTGIQRIVYNLGRYLNEDKSRESGFFIFRHGDFKEVLWEDLETRLATAKLGKPRHANDSKISTAYVRHHGSVLAKRIVTDSALEKPIRKVYSILRSTQGVGTGHKISHIASSPFRDGDTVIVVDGNWQFHGFADAIKATKKHTNYKFIHFIHDIVAIKNPALASEGADKIIGDYFRSVLPITDTLLCISRSTKNDVSDLLSDYIKTTDIRIVALGSDLPDIKSPKKPDIKIEKEFILAVSTVEVRKNYLLMYYVYKKSIADSIDLPNLIIVGKKGWKADDVYNLMTKDPEINNKITIINGISDEELEWLYANCKFTVFPSFYEGWGIPIAESLARGKVCISSSTSSMPEVGEGLVRYLSPYSPHEWLEEMSRLDGKSLNSLEENIRHNYKALSWQDTYNEVIMNI